MDDVLYYNYIIILYVKNTYMQLCSYQCQAGKGVGGRRGIGQDSDRSLWPGVGHLNYLAVPGVGIFEFLFVPVTTNHFPDGEFKLYLTSHFCPGVGNLTAIFWKMSKSRPIPCPSPPPTTGLTLIGALLLILHTVASGGGGVEVE